ncbi:GIY-YIG nuclease family protein [bacterium]|nr:GIY-YIG nuclease family protein [bacterium]
MQEKQSYVYIMSNYTHTTFYIGVTSNLYGRMFQHTNKLADGFTAKYNIKQLLYYEIYSDIETAINREKKLKKWRKQWKWDLIDKVNPERKNLYIDGEILPINQDLI